MKGRSPMWWKSGRLLAWIWVLGTLLIAGSTLPFLYQQWVKAEGLAIQYQGMSTYVDTHREKLESSDLSDPPTPDALSILADKVPPDRDVPRLLLQLQDASEAAEVKLNAVRVADSREELDRLAEEQKDAEEQKNEEQKDKKESGSKEKHLPENPHVKPVWLDVYLAADIPELKEFFHQLHQLTRIVTVQEWEHRLESQPGYGNVRVRLLVYAYRDPELKELPAKSPPDISRKSGDPIRVRPKKKEKNGRSSGS